MDCTDIKAILSGLVDDEVDRDTRHEAERHLATCQPCRSLVSEAEGLNALIALDANAMIAPSLPENFESAVLSRTVYPQTYKFRERRQMWTNAVGWLAAAACLALASLIWYQRPTYPDGPIAQGERGGSTSPIEQVYHTGTNLQNRTFDGDLPITKVAMDTGNPDDADTLYAASVLLDMLNDGDTSSFAGIERVRRIAEYDDLLDRLAEVRQRLPERDRAVVLAAEGILTRAVQGPMSQDDLRQMHDTVARLDLPHEMDAMSKRQQSGSSL